MENLPFIPYSPTTGSWDPDIYGNHRAVVEVTDPEATDIVGVRIPWRRRDDRPQAKGLLLYSRRGTAVHDYTVVESNNGFGDIVFYPCDGVGFYFVYFMPYEGTVKKPYPVVNYRAPDLAETPWRRRHTGQTLTSVPEARFVALESIDEFNRFTEMELTATPSEVERLYQAHTDRPFLVFAEPRTSPIRMLDRLPYAWATDGPSATLEQTARVGEYFVFQLGVHANHGELGNIEVSFGPLADSAGGRVVRGAAACCFNTNGVAWDGTHFTKSVSVEAGAVQPLWCGIEIPADIDPGTYKMEIAVRAEIPEAAEQRVKLTLEVEGPAIPRHGDDEPWRLSRLRWLNSTLGTEDSVVPPFTPVRRDEHVLHVLGREIALGASGFPQQITSRFTDDVQSVEGDPLGILAGPIALSVTESGSASPEPNSEEPELGVTEPVRFTEEGESFVRWESSCRRGGLDFRVAGLLDFDGTIEYQVEVSTNDESVNAEVAMDVPFRSDTAQLMTGLGRKGGTVPDSFDWRWDRQFNQDSVWVGAVNGGLQLSLKDDGYSRPLNTNFYQLKPLVMPRSWANDGNGTIAMRRRGDRYLLRCSSGPLTVSAGTPLRFDFRLAVTPFKPIDTARHFATRYYHAYVPHQDVLDAGANTINIHHASEINPYINYPFLRSDILGRYIAEAHERDLAVKLYYTVRELTTRAPELFALKSLGDEVFVDGPGGGHAWLQEHFKDHYIAAWYALAVRDTSVIDGILSRRHNFYVEGMNWLAENLSIDGVYIDDLGFGREIMKRVRRVLHRHRPQPMIDLHSANQYNERDGFASSTNLYLEHFAYLDRLWFGEYFDYNAPPDYWLVEMSGIPFGLMSEMLQDGGNPWRGMVFGMTGRMPRVETNVALWRFWDEHGLPESRMIGWWSQSSPAQVSNPQILATVYRGEREAVVAVAAWGTDTAEGTLTIDWEKLGADPQGATIDAPPIDGLQEAVAKAPVTIVDNSSVRMSEHPLRIDPGKGILFVLRYGS